MAMRKVYIRSREFIPDLAEITGLNPIEIEYEFGKAEILGEICTFDVDLTDEQASEIDKRAQLRTEGKIVRNGGS